MGVSIGTADITCAYVGSSPLSAIYVGDTKVRPMGYSIEWLLVGGGGAGGRSYCMGGGGGGGGGVLYCGDYQINSGEYCVIIGAGGTGSTTNVLGACQNGKASCFGDIMAYGGGGGGGTCSPSLGCGGGSGGSGGGGGAGNGVNGGGKGPGGSALDNCSQGKPGATSTNYHGGGGGGYCCPGETTCGRGGCGYYSEISGSGYWYASGGGGGRCTSTAIPGVCGGGAGGRCNCAGCPGSNYGAGGGGGGRVRGCRAGGNGRQGIFIARYPASCGYTISGGNCKYECNGYCIHCFTSNGTLTVG